MAAVLIEEDSSILIFCQSVLFPLYSLPMWILPSGFRTVPGWFPWLPLHYGATGTCSRRTTFLWSYICRRPQKLSLWSCLFFCRRTETMCPFHTDQTHAGAVLTMQDLRYLSSCRSVLFLSLFFWFRPLPFLLIGLKQKFRTEWRIWQNLLCAPIHIGNRVWIGAGAIITFLEKMDEHFGEGWSLQGFSKEYWYRFIFWN